MITKALLGLYASKESTKSAVEGLRNAGFRAADIRVLFSTNGETRAFALDNGILPPEGTASGPSSEVALNGSLGITNPAVGSVRGALAPALHDMAVPDDEAERYGDQVTHGRILLSVKCGDAEELDRGSRVLSETGSTLISSN